ncbi:MAG: DUF4430 domain-containing protein [Bacillus sp. (in: Bacteria)]|nr:DUF4430 domain-containing protein [Bacillus sp. (in: firmicutes)]
MKRTLHVFLSFLLVFSMFFTSFPVNSFAEEKQKGKLTIIGLDQPYEEIYDYQDDVTAYDVLKGKIGSENLDVSGTGDGVFLNAIKGVQPGEDEFWAFFINGIASQVGIGGYTVQEGDHLTFKIINFNETDENSVSLTVVGPDGTIENTDWPVSFLPDQNPSAFDLLLVIMGHDKVDFSVDPQWGVSIDGIAGIPVEGTYFWAFYINETSAQIGADSYPLQSGDAIKYNYESWESDGNGTVEDEELWEDKDNNQRPFDNALLQTAIENGSNYIFANSIGEWEAVALRQAGYTIPSSYLENVEKIVADAEGQFRTVTEYERYTLGILAAGGDPTNIAGYNLVEKIYNGNLSRQGLNGVFYGLIAVDSAPFDIPDAAEWTRERMISHLLDAQNDDGGWNWDGSSTSDPDTTAMVLTALAPYKSEANVQEVVANGVTFLAGKYQVDKVDNSSTAAQMVVALPHWESMPMGKGLRKTIRALWSFYLHSKTVMVVLTIWVEMRVMCFLLPKGSKGL